MPEKLNFGQTSLRLVRLLRDSKENQRSLWSGFRFLLKPRFSHAEDVCGRLGREVCKIHISVLTSVMFAQSRVYPAFCSSIPCSISRLVCRQNSRRNSLVRQS